MLRRRSVAAPCALLLLACGGSTSGSASRGSPVAPANPPPQSCGAGGLLDAIGKNKLLIGYSGEDDVAAKAPFDLRYQYLAGIIGNGSQKCEDYSWWQCWGQETGKPPGSQFVSEYIAQAATHTEVAMFTYYVLLPAARDRIANFSEGPDEVQRAATDPAFMGAYLADFRTLLDGIGTSLAFVHIEPDFWGYAGQIAIPKDQDAHSLPAAVDASGDCPSPQFEKSMAGLGRCMISMVRAHAPNAKVGLHASAWGTNHDVLLNESASLDVTAEAQKLGRFMLSLGANMGDFVVADMSDRDAGCYQQGPPLCERQADTWWSTDSALPNFAQAFAWSKALADAVGRPVLWWQIPVGNVNQNDTDTHFKDNRVDYLLQHAGDVVTNGAIGLVFGAGQDHQTTPSTDGGNLVNRTKALAEAGGTPICP
jgi:hypothetical protein